MWLGMLTTLASVLGLIAGAEWIQAWPGVVAGIGTAVGVLTIVIRLLTGLPIRRAPPTGRR